jgi:hypothetical protein
MLTQRRPPRPGLARGTLLAAAVLAAVVLALPAPTTAQDLNFVYPIAEIEARLRDQPFRILDWRGSRAPGDRTQRVTLSYEDGSTMIAKWATAPNNGSAFNNEPRYETAAYVIQQLFLDEADYVVPPTLLRAVPLPVLREQVPEARATFREAPGSALVALQYWLSAVTPDNFWDRQRARTDSVYARHIGNFNILTYVIRHNDANVGNFLISESETQPRVFAVDNGVAFASPASNRGFDWRELQVERLPRRTIERLDAITREQLEQALGVVAEFAIRDGELVPVQPGPNLARNRGVRRTAERIQLGLTTPEIRAVESRIRNLVRLANSRRYELF